MRLFRSFKSLGLALLLAVGVSCTSSDAPSTALGPSEQQAPSFGLIGDLTGGLTTTLVGTLGSVTDLLLCSPQPYAITTQTIGPAGGVLNVGTHSLLIPQYALSAKVTITAEQIRGTTNSVRFSPEGLRFLKPATLTMKYENCALVLLQKKIVFTTEQLKILEVLSSLDLFKSKTVQAPIEHFSRYAVAY
jgi:hypothetical protein